MYAVDENVAANAPEGYVRKLSGGGATYNVYVHSYLGYGLMAGRAATLDEGGNRAHPCIPPNHESTFAYGGKNHYVVGSEGPSADFGECAQVINRAMRVGAACEVDSGCSFNGEWGGPGADEVYAMSYLYERVDQAKAGSFLPNEGVGRITPADRAKAAEQGCSTPLDDFPSLYPEVGPVALFT